MLLQAAAGSWERTPAMSNDRAATTATARMISGAADVLLVSNENNNWSYRKVFANRRVRGGGGSGQIQSRRL
jgi:hypothetical protein